MNRDAYQTPAEVFAPLKAEFDFALDVCASPTNALLPHFITEDENCLTADWFRHSDQTLQTGWYAWMNPPYSNIGPFVKRSAEMAAKGIGTVMLVMMDQSVGWYKEAIKTCQEVRLIIGGRLSFVDPSTGKPAAGNNKGSMFLIWHPFGRTPVSVSHIERDELLAAGRLLLNADCASKTDKSETQADLTAEIGNQSASEPSGHSGELPETPAIAHKWPLEVRSIVEQALDQCPCEPTDQYYDQLCNQVNSQLLSLDLAGAVDSNRIVTESLVQILKKEKSCAA